PNTKQMLTRKYKSSMANKILLAFHRVVSIVLERRKISAVNDAFNETNRNLQQITNELGS
ncbi:unnamed protein product, partial [Rotaria magnacalcarata]